MDNVILPDHQTDLSVANFYTKITDFLDEMAPVKKLTQKEKGLRKTLDNLWYIKIPKQELASYTRTLQTKRHNLVLGMSLK